MLTSVNGLKPGERSPGFFSSGSIFSLQAQIGALNRQLFSEFDHNYARFGWIFFISG
jgi:hypothetical protein